MDEGIEEVTNDCGVGEPLTGVAKDSNNDICEKKKAKSCTKTRPTLKDMIGKLTKSTDPGFSEHDEETRHVLDLLRVHFGNPYTRVKREPVPIKKIPLKMLILLIKLTVVSAQLIMFGRTRALFVDYLSGNEIAIKNLLFKGWDSQYEGHGPFSMYTIDDLHEHIDHAVDKFYKLPTTAVGSFFIGHLEDTDMSNHLKICIQYYENGIFYRNGTIILDPTVVTKCNQLSPNSTDYGFKPTIRQLMTRTNGSLVRLLRVELLFTLTSVRIDMDDPVLGSQCFRIAGQISFNNLKLNGQIKQELETWIDSFECAGFIQNTFIEDDIAVAVIVLLLLVVSLTMSIRSFYYSIKTLKITSEYFRRRQPVIDGELVTELSHAGKCEIIKFRDIIIIISDFCTIAGTGFKMVIDSQALSSSSDLYDACAILIGSGCLLVWLGVLHYLSYDSGLNLLFRVMHKAAGQVVRFLFCFVILFIGFTLCGWVVLGPYHLKFFSISGAIFCLYSILDGDELYLNYVSVDNSKQSVWWFNSIFLTAFHLVFAVIALNIFVAIFTTTYEIMQEKDEKTDLKKWLDSHRKKRKFHKPKKCRNTFCGCIDIVDGL